jgi:hypothetical protein
MDTKNVGHEFLLFEDNNKTICPDCLTPNGSSCQCQSYENSNNFMERLREFGSNVKTILLLIFLNPILNLISLYDEKQCEFNCSCEDRTYFVEEEEKNKWSILNIAVLLTFVILVRLCIYNLFWANFFSIIGIFYILIHCLYYFNANIKSRGKGKLLSLSLNRNLH